MRVSIAFVVVAFWASAATAEEVPRDCDPAVEPPPGAPSVICPPAAEGSTLHCPNGDLIVRDDDGALWRVKREPDPSARGIWVGGLVLMMVGHIVGATTAIAIADGHVSPIDVLPVIGPLVAGANHEAPSAATSTLILSAGAHLAGALLFAAGLQAPHRTVMERVSFGAAVGRNAGTMSLSLRF